MATELFANQGFSDAVTQALADRLGVGKGTIYRHFPSKQALFLAAADRVMRKLQERVNENIAGIDDGLERVERAIAAFSSFFARHPHSSAAHPERTPLQDVSGQLFRAPR